MKLSHPLKKQTDVTQWFGKPHASTAEFYKELGIDGHNGLDFRGAIGTPIKASNSGIARVRTGGDGNKMIMIYNYSERIMTFYCHLNKFLIKDKEEVKEGQVIGHIGNTGKYTTGVHLHFGVYELTRGGGIKNPNNGYKGAVDPVPYLAERLRDWDIVKTPQDPMVFIMKNGYRWWFKNAESFKNWFGYEVHRADIKEINLITQNNYQYKGSIGKD
jgi:murein DD-endopeptidase MepM/ murein hydrolase activator NlpD